MKNIILTLSILSAILTACTLSSQKTELKSPQAIQGKVYGDSIYGDNIQDISALKAMMAKATTIDIIIKGTVEEVCQKKGCWVIMKMPGGENMRVTFKDYAFFLPKDIQGKEIIIDGTAKVDSISVEQQQHYAEDAGQSKEEINKINKSKKTLDFVAKGVVII